MQAVCSGIFYTLQSKGARERQTESSLRLLLRLKSIRSTEDVEICVLEINHNVESAVLTVSENSILISHLYGTWMMKMNPFLFSMINTGMPSVLIHKNSFNS